MHMNDYQNQLHLTESYHNDSLDGDHFDTHDYADAT